VGGAEQVLSHLDQALTQSGHTSVVVACQGSRASGELVSVALPDGVVLEGPEMARLRRNFQEAIDRALATHSVDIIHMHGLDFHRYVVPSDIPTLVTLHMPIPWYGPEVLDKFRHRAQFCCVSHTQESTCPPHLRGIPVIENGVEIPADSGRTEKSNFAVVMGRICAEKNQHAALEAGSLAGTSVLLSGKVFPYSEHKRYFEEKLEPLLRDAHNGVEHRFVGPVPPTKKREMLSSAKCLLHPTLAPETSSLVTMEALAAGTPVIAYPSGALREMVRDGSTGFLVNNVTEMAEAIGKVDRISREECRSEAKLRFARERMIDSYFEMYRRLLKSDVNRTCA